VSGAAPRLPGTEGPDVGEEANEDRHHAPH
jgi:hypothetical protein